MYSSAMVWEYVNSELYTQILNGLSSCVIKVTQQDDNDGIYLLFQVVEPRLRL